MSDVAVSGRRLFQGPTQMVQWRTVQKRGRPRAGRRRQPAWSQQSERVVVVVARVRVRVTLSRSPAAAAATNAAVCTVPQRVMQWRAVPVAPVSATGPGDRRGNVAFEVTLPPFKVAVLLQVAYLDKSGTIRVFFKPQCRPGFRALRVRPAGGAA
jgi:hypothetical protein